MAAEIHQEQNINSDISDDENPIPLVKEKPKEKGPGVNHYGEYYRRLGVFKGEPMLIKEQIKPVYYRSEIMMQNHSTNIINGYAIPFQLWKFEKGELGEDVINRSFRVYESNFQRFLEGYYGTIIGLNQMGYNFKKKTQYKRILYETVISEETNIYFDIDCYAKPRTFAFNILFKLARILREDFDVDLRWLLIFDGTRTKKASLHIVIPGFMCDRKLCKKIVHHCHAKYPETKNHIDLAVYNTGLQYWITKFSLPLHN